MSKIGIEISVNVSKIDKARIYQGKKGKYLKLTTFVDPDEGDQYGNHGFVTQSKDKDEDIRMPILGNSKVFWQDRQQTGASPAPPRQPAGQDQGYGNQSVSRPYDLTEDDLPF